MQGYVTTDGIDWNDIWYGAAGIQAAVDLYRSAELPIVQALAMPWGESIIKYGISQKNGFQVLAQGQTPDNQQISLAAFYPRVRKTGYGVGTDYDTLARSTGKEVALALNRPFLEDPEAVLTRYLQVMMTNPGTNNAGFGFWNGQYSTEEQITAPPQFRQNVFSANHSHYLCSGTKKVLALTDLTAMKLHIQQHGNRGNLVAFINSATGAVIENLAAWNQSGIIRSPITDAIAIQGFTDLFQLLGIVFHVTEMVPDDYILMTAAEQAEQQRTLVMFEPDNLKGLILHPGNNFHYPLINSYFERWFDVKVLNRSAGAVLWFGDHSNTFVSPTFV